MCSLHETGSAVGLTGCHFADRCYLVDEMSYLVVDPDVARVPDRHRSQYEDVSLASKQGYVFASLLAQGVFVEHSRVDYQGVCKFSPSVPSVSLTWFLH